MQSIQLKTRVGPDGILQLNLPVEFKDADLEVKVIVLKQPKRISQTGVIAELTQKPITVSGIRQLTRDEFYVN